MKLRRLFIPCFLLFTLTSCDNWLNVTPEDEISEKDLFSTGNGFRNALNGVYQTLSKEAMYARQMTWGIVDVMGQCYKLDKLENNSFPDLRAAQKYSYMNQELKPSLDEMSENAYTAVANCNNIIQQIRRADSSLFVMKEAERKLILGEAIALRAFIQFDMLRFFAPAPATKSTAKNLPYITTYPMLISNNLTVQECMEYIIADFKQAKELVWKIDSTASFSQSSRLEGIQDGDVFLGQRGTRLNYYAISGLLARAYLYAENHTEAYTEAKNLIENPHINNFKFSEKGAVEKDGDIKLINDILIAFYNDKIVDMERATNRLQDKTKQYFLALQGVTGIFAGQNDDFRFKHQIEAVGGYSLSIKNREAVLGTSTAKVSPRLIPIMRMSEVYYIAGEAIFDTDPTEANDYLTRVKKGRNLINTSLNYTVKKDYMEALIQDARREFIGEGQLFFLYKRLNRSIPTENGDLVMGDKFVLPLPDINVQ